MALPKLKSKHSLVGYWIPKVITAARFLLLKPDEATCDVWREYSAYIEEADLFEKTVFHPMIQGNAECVTPSGMRYAVFLYRMEVPPLSYEILSDYARHSNRYVCQFISDKLHEQSGCTTALADCTVVQRAMRRDK